MGHKLKNTNHGSKSKTQVPITKTLIISHLESYSCVVRSLLIMATRIKQLSLHWFGRVTSHYLSWALLSTSQKLPGTDTCGQIEQKFSGIPVKARKKMIYISEGFTFSVKHSAGMNCSMSLNSPRNYLFFSIQMVRALGLGMTCKDLPVGH